MKHQNLDISQRCAAAPVLEEKLTAGLALLAWNERRFGAVILLHCCICMDVGREVW